MSGFRLALGGAQALYNIMPDLTCFGKIIGGGLPVGAYGGRKEIMELIAPQGPVYQAGTLSGNPLAMTAGLSTLRELQDPKTYEKLDYLGTKLAEGLKKAANNSGVEISVNNRGSMASCFFTTEKVRDYRSATSCNLNKFKAFFQSMLSQGIYLAPSQFEASFISLAHTEEDIDETIEASEIAFSTTKNID